MAEIPEMLFSCSITSADLSMAVTRKFWFAKNLAFLPWPAPKSSARMGPEGERWSSASLTMGDGANFVVVMK